MIRFLGRCHETARQRATAKHLCSVCISEQFGLSHTLGVRVSLLSGRRAVCGQRPNVFEYSTREAASCKADS